MVPTSLHRLLDGTWWEQPISHGAHVENSLASHNWQKQRTLISSSKSCDKKSASGRMCASVCDALSTSLEFGQRWNPHGCKGCVDLHQKSPVVLQLSQFFNNTGSYLSRFNQCLNCSEHQQWTVYIFDLSSGNSTASTHWGPLLSKSKMSRSCGGMQYI